MKCPICFKPLLSNDIYSIGAEWDLGSKKHYEGTEESCSCGFKRWIDWTGKETANYVSAYDSKKTRYA